MPNRRGLSTTAIGAVSGVAFTVGCVLVASVFHRANAVSSPSPPADDVTTLAAPSWPAEIRNVWSALPSGDAALTVKSDQQCATVEDGLLAHCVRVQCQRIDDEQTACVEVVMTARRLRAPPMPAAADGAADLPEPVPPASPVPSGAKRLHRTAQSS